MKFMKGFELPPDVTCQMTVTSIYLGELIFIFICLGCTNILFILFVFSRMQLIGKKKKSMICMWLCKSHFWLPYYKLILLLSCIFLHSVYHILLYNRIAHMESLPSACHGTSALIPPYMLPPPFTLLSLSVDYLFE